MKNGSAPELIIGQLASQWSQQDATLPVISHSNSGLSRNILLCDTQHLSKVRPETHSYWNKSIVSTHPWLLPMGKWFGTKQRDLATVVVSAVQLRGITRYPA